MNETKRKAMIRLAASHSEVASEELDDGSRMIEIDSETGEAASSDAKMEMDSEGILRVTDERIEIEYFETELTGMEGSCTCISFERENPGLVTMLRTGSVETALVFEAGKRHTCAYNAGQFVIETCVRTFDVKNELGPEGGRLELDYSIEFRGATTERISIKLSVSVIEA